MAKDPFTSARAGGGVTTPLAAFAAENRGVFERYKITDQTDTQEAAGWRKNSWQGNTAKDWHKQRHTDGKG